VGIYSIHDEDKEYLASTISNIPQGIWWSIITLTTVGYGDKLPGSNYERIVAAVGILFGFMVIFASNFLNFRVFNFSADESSCGCHFFKFSKVLHGEKKVS
jgi:voltage-gated potassium channel Kch